MTSYSFDTASDALPVILRHLIEHGDEVSSRNGRVKELLNAQIILNDSQRREILCFGRKANVFAQIAETMWVLAGRNDVEWLSAYLPRAKDYSDDGKTWRGGYGPRIRGLHFGFDQLAHVIDILREDPLSRRAVIAIYDPEIDTESGRDIPCNDFLQFQSRLGALHLTVTVRSNDAMWGWSGINAFEWSTLQEIVAHLLGLTVGTLTFNIGNLHVYEQHWNRADRIAYADKDGHVYPITPFRIPDHMDRTLEWVDSLIGRWFAWEGMCRKGEATPDLLDDFEEPLLKSWAAAIAWYWQREDYWLEMLDGTALGVAVARTPASVLSEAPQTSRSMAAGVGHNLQSHERVGVFYAFVKDLHAKKHASYGDSWKKRGEKISILPNMARKVDRLGVGDEFDSSADTLIDLLVYTIKYGCWIQGRDDGPENVNTVLSRYLAETEHVVPGGDDIEKGVADIIRDFNRYCDMIDNLSHEEKLLFARDLALRIAPIARDVWWEEQPDPNAGDDCTHVRTRIFLKNHPNEHEKCLDCGALIEGDDYQGADVD